MKLSWSASMRPACKPGPDHGGVLVVALVAMFVAVTLAYSAASIATSQREDLANEDRDMRARALADAGAHRAMTFVQDSMRLSPFVPFAGIDALVFANSDPNQPQTFELASDEALQNGLTTYGTFTVTLDAVANGDWRDVTITSTGYVPDAAAPLAKSTVQAVVRFGLEPGEVFDYSYFINNWGWFYGNTINSYGNVKSNGQFDAANYAPGAFGSPRYGDISLADPANPDLLDYKDDNEDGVMDGTDGGIFAGWDIVNAGNVRGMGGQPENQQEYVNQTPMPNLSDLTAYEALANGAGSSLQIGGGLDAFGNPLPPTVISDGVLGDEAGEKQHVVLIGTTLKPIIVNGPVVVRGSVIIKGVVSGKGAIYTGGNVYIPHNLTYLNGPASWLPTDNSEGATEAWIAANQSKDFLGLFAREHVVMGDYTHAWWQHYVGHWLADSMNASKEDAGADLIPNTADGRDGIPNTADDDVLEGDSVWTVEHYTQEHADLGLIPAGRTVGDVIPGSGEDIDGDGAYDATATLTQMNLPASLTSGQWAGNLPGGTTAYNQIATINLVSVHAAMYTNHAAALVTLASGQHFNIFGSLVSRNESMIYGTASLNLTHDRRLSGGGLFGDMLPKSPAELQILAWQRFDNDVSAGALSP